ncbi:hypothetical protein ACOME3_009475 [Neoechinorhynchus agilis]
MPIQAFVAPLTLVLSTALFVSSGAYVQGNTFNDFARRYAVRFDHFSEWTKIKTINENVKTQDPSKIDMVAHLFSVVDNNNDSFITELELEDWIRSLIVNYSKLNNKKYFTYYDTNMDGVVEWSEIYNTSYAFAENQANLSKSALQSIRHQLKKDARRFIAADFSNKSRLNIQEFEMFACPELYSEMDNITLLESFENVDTNNDGLIDFVEFKEDILSNSNPVELSNEDIDQSPRERFIQLDVNNDQKLDLMETKPWLLTGFDAYVRFEVAHIFSHVDENKDAKLSLKEIMRHRDVLIGSEATQYGKLLESPNHEHDEF